MTQESNIPLNIPGAVEKLPDDIPSDVHVVKNYINGKWVEPRSGKYILNKKPATGELFSYIPRSSRKYMK
jgi:hypothetical protein